MKNLLLRNHKGDEGEIWHICLGHQPLHDYYLYSGQIGTLVAMATYIFHRLKMEKAKIDIFFCLIVDWWSNLIFFRHGGGGGVVMDAVNVICLTNVCVTGLGLSTLSQLVI